MHLYVLSHISWAYMWKLGVRLTVWTRTNLIFTVVHRFVCLRRSLPSFRVGSFSFSFSAFTWSNYNGFIWRYITFRLPLFAVLKFCCSASWKRTQHCWMLHVASVCTSCSMLLRVVGSCWPTMLHPFARSFKGDVTRGDSQRRFLAQHSLAMLEQCWNHSKQCCNAVLR